MADNDLRCNEEERGLDYILEGLLYRTKTRDTNSVEHIAYMNNEIGERSAFFLQELLEKPK